MRSFKKLKRWKEGDLKALAAFADANPKLTYADIAKVYGVTDNSIGNAMRRARLAGLHKGRISAHKKEPSEEYVEDRPSAETYVVNKPVEQMTFEEAQIKVKPEDYINSNIDKLSQQVNETNSRLINLEGKSQEDYKLLSYFMSVAFAITFAAVMFLISEIN